MVALPMGWQRGWQTFCLRHRRLKLTVKNAGESPGLRSQTKSPTMPKKTVSVCIHNEFIYTTFWQILIYYNDSYEYIKRNLSWYAFLSAFLIYETLAATLFSTLSLKMLVIIFLLISWVICLLRWTLWVYVSDFLLHLIMNLTVALLLTVNMY